MGVTATRTQVEQVYKRGNIPVNHKNLRAGGPVGNRASHRAFRWPVRADHRQRVDKHMERAGDMWLVSWPDGVPVGLGEGEC